MEKDFSSSLHFKNSLLNVQRIWDCMSGLYYRLVIRLIDPLEGKVLYVFKEKIRQVPVRTHNTTTCKAAQVTRINFLLTSQLTFCKLSEWGKPVVTAFSLRGSVLDLLIDRCNFYVSVNWPDDSVLLFGNYDSNRP